MNMQKCAVLLSALTVIGLSAIGGVSLTIIPGRAQAPSTVDPTSQKCPKCGGAMESGFIRDYFASNGFDHAAWSPAGERPHLFNYGKMIKMTVYRCEKCGYLEAYAR